MGSLKIKHTMSILKNIFFIISIFLTSCAFNSNHTNSKLKSFELSKMKDYQKIRLSDLNATYIEYIPLETNTLSLISKIREIRVCDDFFLVINFDIILKFRRDGTFLTKIGEKGKGPSEFLNAHCVAVNPYNNNIYIVSGWENKIYVYSVNNAFLKSFKSPFKTKKIEFIGKNILCYSPNTDGTIINSYNLIDTNGRIIKSFPNKYPYKSRENTILYQHENLFYNYKNQLLKKEIYSDTVYVFENNKFEPKYVFNIGDDILTPDARECNLPIDLMKNYITQWNLFEFNEKIYFEYSKNGNRLCFIGSTKDNWQVTIARKRGFINDIDGGVNINFSALLDDSTVIGWVTPIKLRKHVLSKTFKNSKPKFPEKKKELEKIANSLDENDNPVLILIKLK